MNEYTFGRDTSCDYVILDPQKRVSRNHGFVYELHGEYFIKDTESANGIYINNQKIPKNTPVKFKLSDVITLSKDFVLDVFEIMPINLDKTLVMVSQNLNLSSAQNNLITLQNGNKKVSLDIEKTSISDVLELDNTPYLSIGRGDDNKVKIPHTFISRNHCKMRLITPQMIEIIDLGSSNGTFVDNQKLQPHKPYQFSSAANIKLGSSFSLDLKKLFPNIQIVHRNNTQENVPKSNLQNHYDNSPITKAEKKAFIELEYVWKEYMERQNSANNAAMGYGIGGAVFGIAAAAFTGLTGGIGGIVLMSGGGIVGRYLGQQKTNEIKGDLTYEDMFLETYCCPRCKESFQRKPWVTIRDCYKCKIKFK
jgi:pSer/pThr/pTyr-binding forkhead associated (FHA) protein